MKQTSTPNIFNPQYLLTELAELLRNNQDAPQRLIENLLNVDYDFADKDATYKTLTPAQRSLLQKIHQHRKTNADFDLQVQKIVFAAAGMTGLGFVITKLFETTEE